MKLSMDEKESLGEFAESPAHGALLKYCDQLVFKMERSVINCPVHATGRDIVMRKAQLDGANQLRMYIDQMRKGLKDA